LFEWFDVKSTTDTCTEVFVMDYTEIICVLTMYCERKYLQFKGISKPM